MTMTDPEGIPICDVEGDKIEHKLAEGENERTIASRLTLENLQCDGTIRQTSTGPFLGITGGSTRAWSAFGGKAEMDRRRKPAGSVANDPQQNSRFV